MSTPENPQKKEELQKKSLKSVTNYLVVLFAAAFVLLLLTYMMERRNSQVEMSEMSGIVNIVLDDKADITSQRDKLRDEIAALQSEITEREAENKEQLLEILALEDKITALERSNDLLEQKIIDLTPTEAVETEAE